MSELLVLDVYLHGKKIGWITHLPEDQLALKFVDSRAFASLTREQFKRFATKSHLPESIVLETVQETLIKFKTAWKNIGDVYSNHKVTKMINEHLNTIPMYSHF